MQITSLLSQLSKLNQTYSRTKALHAHVIKYQLSLDPFYATKIIRFYAINDDLASAQKLFDRISQRSIFLWNSIIRGYAQAHKFSDAFALLKRMLSSEIKPDNFTFACILRACWEKNDVEGLRAVHGKVVSYGLEVDFICSSALVSGYSKLDRVHEASRVFYGICEPDLVLWNTIISGHGRCGTWQKGLELFNVMLTMGKQPDGFTMVGLITGLGDPSLLRVGESIHGFCLKNGFVSNDHISSMLVSMYSRCKCMDSACRVFDSLLEPDLVIWSALITGLSLVGNYVQALLFFRKLILGGGKADPLLLSSLLATSAKLAILGPGIEIHGYAVRHGFDTEIMVSSALVDMYAKCGFLRIGLQVFRAMPRRNIVSYNALISSLGLYGRASEAFGMFREIIKEGLEPDKTTFSCLLCACCHAGLVSDGREYFRMMKDEFGIHPETEHYVYMVKLLGMAGYLEEVYNLINSRPGPVSSSIWGALLSCCDAHKNYKLAGVIGWHLLDNKPEGSSYNVMFSNLYASDGRWDDVKNIWVDIGETGKKMPGISWISSP